MTKMSGPVDRLFPLLPPEPEPGCAICAGLDRERTAAQAEGDYSMVSDCNIGIRGHGSHAPIPG